ncbi:MAG: SiaB family protein kinase [Flavobacteriales bacterium]|nr:SiaB family protein kinase [Flavobacteriales bacterium]
MNTQIRYISDLHRVMSEKKLTLVYEGRLSRSIINSLLHMCRTNLDSLDVSAGVQKKVYAIMVEVLESLHKQSQSSKRIHATKNLHFPIVMMGIKDNMLFITTGNLVSNGRAEKLREKFNQVNRLDKQSLRTLHMDALTNKEFFEKGYSDLALVDIALRSGHHLEYDFDKVDEEFQFYMMQIKVTLEKSAEFKAEKKAD